VPRPSCRRDGSRTRPSARRAPVLPGQAPLSGRNSTGSVPAGGKHTQASALRPQARRNQCVLMTIRLETRLCRVMACSLARPVSSVCMLQDGLRFMTPCHAFCPGPCVTLRLDPPLSAGNEACNAHHEADSNATRSAESQQVSSARGRVSPPPAPCRSAAAAASPRGRRWRRRRWPSPARPAART